MSHRYIVSSTPYLKQNGRPIYKVPPRGNPPNPYHWKPGPLQNLIQIGEAQNDMVNIIIAPPKEDVVDVVVDTEDVESTQEREVHIIITPIYTGKLDVASIKPIKTRKVRVGNRVKIVPITTL